MACCRYACHTPPMYLCSALRAILPEEPDGGLKDGDPYGALPLRDRTEAPLAGARFVASKTRGSGITNAPRPRRVSHYQACPGSATPLIRTTIFKVFSLFGALFLRTVLTECHQIVTRTCQNAGNASPEMLKSGFFTISSQTDWEYSLEYFNIVIRWYGIGRRIKRECESSC